MFQWEIIEKRKKMSCDPNLQKLCGVVSASKQATRKKLGVDGFEEKFWKDLKKILIDREIYSQFNESWIIKFFFST